MMKNQAARDEDKMERVTIKPLTFRFKFTLFNIYFAKA